MVESPSLVLFRQGDQFGATAADGGIPLLVMFFPGDHTLAAGAAADVGRYLRWCETDPEYGLWLRHDLRRNR